LLKGFMGGFGVKVQHFPLTLLVVLTTLTLSCERGKYKLHKILQNSSEVRYTTSNIH